MNDETWTTAEKAVARAAFDAAYNREVEALIQEIRDGASTVKTVDEIWRLHDFLSAKRHDIDGKYDYRYPVLIFVFSKLVREGWMQLSDLEGLAADKLTKIHVLSSM